MMTRTAAPVGRACDVVVTDTFDLELFDELLVTAPGLAAMVEELTDRFEVTVDLIRDVLLVLWQASPRLRGVAEMLPDRELHHLVVTTLIALPETAALRQFSVHDSFGAAIATVILQERLELLLAAAEQTDVAEMAPVVRSLLRAGLSEAEAGLAEEVAAFASWGTDRTSMIRLPYAQRAAMVERFSTPRMAALLATLDRLGRSMPRLAQAREELWDVDRSDRIADVLPAELAQLSQPALRLDFYRALAEGALLTQAYRGVAPLATPLTICLDVSASMLRMGPEGLSREVWAKGFVLALLAQVRVAKRDAEVLLFAAADNHRVFCFPADDTVTERLIEMTETVLGGGTDFASALQMAMNRVTSHASTAGGDLVFVTDGECRLSADQVDALTGQKRSHHIRVHGVAVGARSAPSWSFADATDTILSFGSTTPEDARS